MKEPLAVALAKLSHLEALAAEAQRITGIGTWQYNPDSGTTIWSAEVYRMFGVSPKSFTPGVETFLGCVHPDDRAVLIDQTKRAFATGQAMDVQHRIVTPAGDERCVHSRAQVVTLEPEEGPILLGTVQDITERREAEDLIAAQADKLKAMQDELIFLTRQSAMGTMAATLAHELNQPLTAISNYASGLKHIVADRPTAREALEEIQANALRAGEVIKRLREMTLRGTRNREVFKVDLIVQEISTLIAAGACEGTKLSYRLRCGASVQADRVQIQQVVLNLVRNACEALADAPVSEVIIETSNLRKFVKIAVRDSGPGIRDENLALLFDSKASTKPGGMGLGLSISRTIVEDHGGKLGAENLKAGGARFWFTLPAFVK